MLLSLIIVTALGPLLYRFAYEPLGEAPMLALLIVSMALHFVLIGIALYSFGAEGVSTPALTDASFDTGPIEVSGQSLCVGLVCLVMVGALRWFSIHTLYGKALRAAASDRLGARLIGVDHALSGRAAFALASFAAAVSGLLIAPITPLSYDTGFEIGLKGFVAAVIGGLASYPLAAAGALIVGLLESFSGFWASEYRNIIVFSLLIPVLIWLSPRAAAIRRTAQDRPSNPAPPTPSSPGLSRGSPHTPAFGPVPGSSQWMPRWGQGRRTGLSRCVMVGLGPATRDFAEPHTASPGRARP